MTAGTTTRSENPPADASPDRRTILLLLFLAGFINYVDRAALPVLAPLIVRELRFDAADLGTIFSGFAAGYAAFCLVGGWASDRFGPERVLLASAVLWSLFCGLTAAFSSLAALLVVRIVFGMAEGGLGAASTKLIGRWFPRDRQAQTLALAATGTTLGGALAGPIAVSAASMVGWRGAFLVIAALGLLWSTAWWAFFRHAPSPPSTTVKPGIARHPAAGSTSGGGFARSTLRTAFRRPIVTIAFAFFGYSYILYFFLSWFPSFLLSAKHISLQQMSFVSTIPWLLGTIGLSTGGAVSDWIFRRTGDALLSRRLILVTSLTIAACGVILAGIVDSPSSAVILMSIAVFSMYLSGSLYFVLVLDLVPLAQAGTVTGVVHFAANCAGILAPLITGFVVKATGLFAYAFVLAGAFAIIGALGMALVISSGSENADQVEALSL